MQAGKSTELDDIGGGTILRPIYETCGSMTSQAESVVTHLQLAWKQRSKFRTVRHGHEDRVLLSM